MRWAEITIETTPQAQDAVSNLMIENGCTGTASEGENPVAMKCYLPVDDRLENRLLGMRTALTELPGFGIEVGDGELTINYAEDEEWAESWKQYFHTTRVGKHIVIKPVWEEYKKAPGDIVIEIDPGMAFGTGSHQTTRLCLQAMEKYFRPRSIVVDFGTGSGILAVAAAKLGAAIVIAFDDDDIAVKSARENVIRNNVEERVEVHWAKTPAFVGKEVDMVVANIVAETIMEFAEVLAGMIRLGGRLVASGITTTKALDVEQALRNVGFDITETFQEDDWVSIVALKAR